MFVSPSGSVGEVIDAVLVVFGLKFDGLVVGIHHSDIEWGITCLPSVHLEICWPTRHHTVLLKSRARAFDLQIQTLTQ